MTIQDVGAQDPELRNSPIAEETLDPDPTLSQEAPEDSFCYFNGTRFKDGAIVRSGTSMLRCEGGVWFPFGPGDPDNP